MIFSVVSYLGIWRGILDGSVCHFIAEFYLYYCSCFSLCVVAKNNTMEARETDSPTPPLLMHNHVMNNVDYAKDEIKDKNSFNNEENHVKIEGSLARFVSWNEMFYFRLFLNTVSLVRVRAVIINGFTVMNLVVFTESSVDSSLIVICM